MLFVSRTAGGVEVDALKISKHGGVIQVRGVLFCDSRGFDRK
jgi:hypothetical protein